MRPFHIRICVYTFRCLGVLKDFYLIACLDNNYEKEGKEIRGKMKGKVRFHSVHLLFLEIMYQVKEKPMLHFHSAYSPIPFI